MTDHENPCHIRFKQLSLQLLFLERDLISIRYSLLTGMLGKTLFQFNRCNLLNFARCWSLRDCILCFINVCVDAYLLPNTDEADFLKIKIKWERIVESRTHIARAQACMLLVFAQRAVQHNKGFRRAIQLYSEHGK